MPTTNNTGPNLTMFTYLGRQTLKFALIAIIILIVGRFSLTAFINFWQAIHPEPPPPPTMGFGALPTLSFPQQTETEKPQSYKLETATGGLPSFGDRAKVFLMIPSSLGLLADQKAKEVASELSFIFEPQILSTRIYRWTKSQPLESTLQIDIQNFNLKFTTDYLSRPELLSQNELPDNFTAVAETKNFLQKIDLLAFDISTASGEVVYKKSLAGELTDAVSFSDADFLAVDLNRTPIDNQFRMFTPEGYQGIVHSVVMGLGKGKSIVHLESNYHPVDYSSYHTYPLRTTQSAWNILKSGEGYIANKGKNEQAVIRKVVLAYYDDFEEQSYLQPIYVFLGDDDFLGYVSALDPEVVSKAK